MIMKLIKLPFKVVAVALVPALMVLHFAGAIVLGLSSIFTNLLASLFLFGSIQAFCFPFPAGNWVRSTAHSMMKQPVY